MAKGKIDHDLEEAARSALKAALEVEEHNIKGIVHQAIEEAVKEYRESMRHVLLEMAPTTDDVVGECDTCHAIVQAKYLKKVPVVEHQRPIYGVEGDHWLFMCSACAKRLEEKGGISRVTVRYEEAYTTELAEKGVIEKQTD